MRKKEKMKNVGGTIPVCVLTDRLEKAKWG